MPLGPPPPGGYDRKPVASVVPDMLPSPKTGRLPVEGCPLTERQLQIVWLASYGLTNPEIADRLSLSNYTVKTHLQHIMATLVARDRAHTVAVCLRLGFVQ